MPRDATLFDETAGCVFEAFLVLRAEDKNIPPAWADRARESRKNREAQLSELLEANSLEAVQAIREWELAYRKECFYRGLRALFDMQRTGKTKI